MAGKQRFCGFRFRTGAHAATAGLRIVFGLAVLVLMPRTTFSQTHEESSPSAAGMDTQLRLEPPTQSIRAFPRVSLGVGRDLEYLGSFCANAKYKKPSKFTSALEALGSISQSTSVFGEDAAKQAAAPGWMIVPARTAVEDFEAPAHATRVVHPNSSLATLRDAIVTFAYGPARVMGAPQQMTTDSKLRVIISDPELRAVHVFDPSGKTSFSILGDQGRRLQLPAGVAVDAEDNIYIADSERGVVLVYDQYGQFVRFIGMFHGENMYEHPTGIAIDRKARRLYLADTPRNLVFVLDLQGNVLNRVGKDKNGNGRGEFVSPTQIAVSGHGIAVLDTEHSRIQVLDFEGSRTACYRVVVDADGDNAMAVDKDGNIYISYVARSIISIYRPDGMPMGTFGQSGGRIGEFRAPKGLWVDGSNRIYVADTVNARVQVFQISTAQTSSH